MYIPDQQVEQIARALYEATDNHLVWDDAFETTKAQFRLYAREAIALLDKYKGAEGRRAHDSPFLNRVRVSR
ncbi:hypothetical protein [Microvirga sp. BSC39]|uniref:hypothetical protein n=1 Tax=Microvirga sp. BSC39 TaxID=1549810 RepID=UPI0004E9567B|nr:hypothetical protein [Microvirga sp. BSC39]KFG66510.1 hypothetical protein JH26_28165 [Microvirga sp. BSC39]